MPMPRGPRDLVATDDDRAAAEAFRRRWQKGLEDVVLPPLRGSVGRDQPNRSADVALVELMLGRRGFLDLNRTEGPTGYFGPPQEEAIRKYQKESGLTVDGWLAPDGETIRALGADMSGLWRPTAAQENPQLVNALHRGRSLLDEDGGVTQANWIAGGHLLQRGQHAARSLGRLLPPLVQPRPPEQPKPDAGAPRRPADEPFIPRPPSPIPSRVEPLPGHPPAKPEVPQIEGYEPSPIGRFFGEWLVFRNPFGSRGDPTTQKGNDIVVRECQKVIEQEFIHGVSAEHTLGATIKGAGQDKMKEEVVQGGGERGRPDATWKIRLPDGNTTEVRLNTVDTLVDGVTPNSRERTALDKLRRIVGPRIVGAIKKLRPGDNQEEYARKARQKCREIFGQYVERLDG